MVLPEIDYEVAACIYKLYYGDRYVIIKGKTLAGSIYFVLQNGYSKFLAAGGGTGRKKGGAGQKEWEESNHFYKKFYRWVKKNSFTFTVEVILESDDAYELLKREQIELNKSIRDKKCLNNNVLAYIPKYREKTGMYGWISAKEVALFRRFITKGGQMITNVDTLNNK